MTSSLRLAFASSLLLNLGFIVYLILGMTTSRTTVETPLRDAPSQSDSAVAGQSGAVSMDSPAAVTPPDTRSAHYKARLVNLRSAGADEDTIREILGHEVKRDYWHDIQQLIPKAAEQEYWKRASYSEPIKDQTTLLHVQALRREQYELLSELLGEPYYRNIPMFTSHGYPTMNSGMWGYLGPEQKLTLLEEYERYQFQRQPMLGAEVAQQSFNEWETRAQEILGADAYELHLLRASSTAWRMRQELKDFEATESEFRRIFRIRRPYEADLRARADYGRRHKASRQIEAQLRKALGDRRFGEYQRAKDNNYRALMAEARERHIDRETINRSYDDLKALAEQGRQIRQDNDLALGEKQNRMAKLQVQMNRSIGTLFGADIVTDEGFMSRFHWPSVLDPQSLQPRHISCR